MKLLFLFCAFAYLLIQPASANEVDNLDGVLKWKFYIGDVNRNVHKHSSPAIDSHGNIYIVSFNNVIYSVDSAGALRWKKALNDGDVSQLGVSDISPTIHNGQVYALATSEASDTLVALTTSGSELWRLALSGKVHNGLSIDSRGNILLGMSDFNVIAINPLTQSIHYLSSQLGNYPLRNPYTKIASDSNGNIFIGVSLNFPSGNSICVIDVYDKNHIYKHSLSLPAGTCVDNGGVAIGKEGTVYSSGYRKYYNALCVMRNASYAKRHNLRS